MARRMNLFASKITNLFVLLFIMLFVINFCHSLDEETKLSTEKILSTSIESKYENEILQENDCLQFFIFNVGFSVVLAMLWNAGRAMKIGTI